MLCIGTDLVALWTDTSDASLLSLVLYGTDRNDNRILPIQSRFPSILPVHSLENMYEELPVPCKL